MGESPLPLSVSTLDSGLAMAANQLAFVICNLEDGITPQPTMWSLANDGVRMNYIVAGDSHRAREMARQLATKHYADAKAITTVFDTLTTDPRSGKQYDTLLLELTAPNSSDRVQLALPYVREGRDVSFPAGFQLFQADVPAEYTDARLQTQLLSRVPWLAETHKSAALARMPSSVTTDLVAVDRAPRASQLTALQLAPFVVFILVAGADGTVDQGELRALPGGLRTLAQETTILGEAVEVAMQADAEETLRLVRGMGLSGWVTTLSAVRVAIDDVLDPRAANAEKQALFALGHMIADASGGFMGFGRVDADEKRALALIAATLGIEAAM
jgi:hypothetical protein